MKANARSAAALLLLVSACRFHSGGSNTGVDSDSSTTPTVVSTIPLNAAVDVALDESVSATFSEDMDRFTLTSSTFTLTSEPGAVPVPGTVLYASSTAVFWPAARLGSNGSFTATITTDANSASGVALAANRAWNFTTGMSLAAGVPVNLGTAANYVILTKAGISTVPISSVTGDIAVSPAAASYITGFSLTADTTNEFATATQVTGKIYAASYVAPTPAKLTAAVLDMEAAFGDVAARAPDVLELGAGNIGGMTLTPGVYKWTTGLLIPTSVTLAGGPKAVWIFQVAQGLTMSSAKQILLTGGARAKNVFWEVSGIVDIGTTAHLEGIVLGHTAVTLHTGSSINGRLLALTTVGIDGSTVVPPAP
jgi:hypothetical protein